MARLARLRLTDEELPRLEAELGRIVAYVDELASVDVSGVSESQLSGPSVAPLRDDEPRPGLTRDAALAEAPRTSDGAFAVPEFVDES